MEIKIKTTDFEMTDEVQKHIEGTLAAAQKMLKGDDAALCDVNVGRAIGSSRHGEVWFAEFNLIHTGNAHIRAYARADTVNVAVDKARDELIQQLRKSKRFHIRMLRTGGAAIKKLMRWE
jgi:ribosomal subunit interface protein